MSSVPILGKVYNITAYFRFHPGGKEDLMKAAGKDCTILFDEVSVCKNVVIARERMSHNPIDCSANAAVVSQIDCI